MSNRHFRAQALQEDGSAKIALLLGRDCFAPSTCLSSRSAVGTMEQATGFADQQDKSSLVYSRRRWVSTYLPYVKACRIQGWVVMSIVELRSHGK